MEIWSEIRREVLTGALSKRAAIAKYKVGWHTLKKMLANDEPPGYRQAKQRPKPKLDAFLPVLRQMLEDDGKAPPKQRHTARRIFERLRDEHGYTGGETVVKDAVREWRISRREVFLPLSHPPGEAQVDFGEATVRIAGKETKSTVLLRHHLKALKLPTILAEAEKIAQRCAADNADHLAFLLQLVELELIERERKAAERRLKAARFPATKLLDEFDFTARPSVNKPQVLELVKGEYLDRRALRNWEDAFGHGARHGRLLPGAEGAVLPGD